MSMGDIGLYHDELIYTGGLKRDFYLNLFPEGWYCISTPTDSNGELLFLLAARIDLTDEEQEMYGMEFRWDTLHQKIVTYKELEECFKRAEVKEDEED